MSRTWKTIACAVALSATTIVATPAWAGVTPDAPPGIESPTSPSGWPAGKAGPEFGTFVAASTWSKANLGSKPKGVNPSSCTPKPGQSPIVLIPGTGEDAFATWSLYGPQLSLRGYCVYLQPQPVHSTR